MPDYDPQRSRSRRRPADDGSAPVDDLLGPAPDPAASPPSVSDHPPRLIARVGPAVTDVDGAPERSLPDPTARITAARAVVAVAALALVAAAVGWWRRRRAAAHQP